MIENINQGLICYIKNKQKLQAKRIVQKEKEKLSQIWRKLYKTKIIRWKNFCKMKEIAVKLKYKKQKVAYKEHREMLKDLKMRKKTK